MTQTRWSDEQLSAFLDGELPANETEALLQEAETDDVLAARVERLGRANVAFLAAAGAIDRQPVAEGLKVAMAAAPVAKVIRFRPQSIAAFMVEHRAVAAALIGAVAVWSVFASVNPAADPSPDAGGRVLASSPLHQVLEETPSSVAVELAAGVSATPGLSFATVSGDICRQYRVDSPAGRSDAIACRDDGRWRVELAVFGVPRPDSSDYQIASGAASRAIDRFIDGAIAGTPFDATEEKERIERGWRMR